LRRRKSTRSTTEIALGTLDNSPGPRGPGVATLRRRLPAR
jgi:hypothetical protein